MNTTSTTKKDRPPPVVATRDPEPGLEEELEENPQNTNAKVDVGSDESMDASDPSSVVQPEHGEPAPSSGFDDDDDESKT